MIAYISGTILDVLDTSVIVKSEGLGYEIFLSASLMQAAQVGANTEYYLHHHIREDQQNLYGFSSLQERDLFRQFLSVSGIGPKSALAALTAAPRTELIRAIQFEDHSVFQAVSGIGPKTAKRLVLELKSKVDWDEATPADLASMPIGGKTSLRVDLLLALEQLGFPQRQVEPIVQSLDLETLQLEEAVKLVLAQLR